jgi:hypothetical protein
LKRQENYSASYGAVRDYLKYRFCARQTPNKILWEQLYEKITSSSKKDAINILRSLSFNASPLISSTRLQRFGRDVASLREHRVLCSRHAQTRQDVDWLNQVLRTDTSGRVGGSISRPDVRVWQFYPTGVFLSGHKPDVEPFQSGA